jgi:integrase
VVKTEAVTTPLEKVTTMLTDAKCKHATAEGKTIRKLADRDGLYLWVYADGRKYWRLRYKVAGVEKSLSLGVYPKVGLKTARARLDAERKHLDNKLDPSTERRADKLRTMVASANSFKAVADEWYGKKANVWVAHHAKDVRRRLDKNIYPHLGNRPISEINALELLTVIRKIEARGAHDLSHRVLSVCGQIFRYGVVTGRCASDISKDLRGALTPHKKTKQAAVRPEEFPALLRAIGGYGDLGDKQTQLALQLLALTFVRTNELIGAEWDEFNFDSAIWTIPANRMKMKQEHLVPLSRQAIDLLGKLKETCGGSRFVFPGRSRDKPVSNNTMLFALYRLGYKGKMTGHGFRAVASTILNEQGFRADVIERQLAHSEQNEVRAAYNRAEYLVERKKMMQHWGDYVESVQSIRKIVPIRPGKRKSA